MIETSSQNIFKPAPNFFMSVVVESLPGVFGQVTQSLWVRASEAVTKHITKLTQSGERPFAEVALDLERIEEPHCIVYHAGERVYFKRDRWGRCGLMFRIDQRQLTLSVLPKAEGFDDVPVNGIYCFDLKTASMICIPYSTAMPYWNKGCVSGHTKSLEDVSKAFLSAIPDTAEPPAVLFSGGLDSTLVAAALAQRGAHHIDLLSVSFASAGSPDRITSLCSFIDLSLCYPQTRFRLLLRDVGSEDVKENLEALKLALLPEGTIMDFNIGAALFFAASGTGIYVDDIDTASHLLGFDNIIPLEMMKSSLEHVDSE
eukprot:Blabericola_migrator_1__4445@NODE_2380_length_2853_cov_60_959440_g1490_i0_p1_GENE_NODE_2380_length_2853_cov_60_959440_g1490_i0NODE_2380_length_2853_cov_60_959440_g1490_i0_p1_ORF_typecomplete_len315_score45_69Asn_synthase/PF00733_21/4_9e10QueC/PF06508_13/0_0012ThiI/PF02568_14/0_014tRNA_Me_trans/PF03054_16/0_083NAD_synthase/PF02540_17/0_14GATase_7/PF13537_6/0_57GATase_7/PF13537_6/1_6e03ATP_bind_3/PF01171_20/0_21_NODE_2380_length_2853_cov_60_959440_g1490_i010381982